MKNSIIVPFDLNTARKIKSGEIEGSVLIKEYNQQRSTFRD